MYPSVTRVEPRDNYQIYVEFDNNECGVLDMEPYLNFGVFSKLRNLAEFSNVRVAFDTLEWGNGIDLDPEFVYEKCVKEKRTKTHPTDAPKTRANEGVARRTSGP